MDSDTENVEEAATLCAIHAFLRDEFFSLTLKAAVQRGDVYSDAAPESAKKTFRSELRLKLEELASQYCTPATEDIHLKNIRSLTDYLTKNCARSLKGERLEDWHRAKGVESLSQVPMVHRNDSRASPLPLRSSNHQAPSRLRSSSLDGLG